MTRFASGGYVRELRIKRRLFWIFPYTTIHPKPHLQQFGNLWVCRTNREDPASHAYAGTSPRSAWDAWARWWLI